jgi:hypothetical protein
MEKEGLKIILLVTPFQFKQLKALSALYASDSEVRIAFSSFIPVEEIRNSFPKAKPYPYQARELQLEAVRISQRMTDLIKRPFKTVSYYRKVIKKNKTFIQELTAGCSPSKPIHLILFNDRDFLTQLTLRHVKKWGHVRVTAIDEGLGYYIKEGLREKVLKAVYKVITPLLFGFDYLFIEQYGTHPQIQEVYLRFPKQLQIRKPNVTYKLILPSPISRYIQNILPRPCALLFSTLLSEENYLSPSEEREFYLFLADHLLQEKISLAWKPHPREDLLKVKEIEALLKARLAGSFQRIESDVNSESINFSSFDLIINFGSTLILYMLEAGYPPENIVTFKLSDLDLQVPSSMITLDFHKSRNEIKHIFHELAAQTHL